MSHKLFHNLDIVGNITLTGNVDGRNISSDGSNFDTHVNATSSIHGLLGQVVGTVDTQTLLNKTINGAKNTLVVSTSDIVSGVLADARISVTNVTQYTSSIDHNSLAGYVGVQHLDWTSDQGTNSIHQNNITKNSVTQHLGSIEHGSLAKLSSDDHSQYMLMIGRSGGQTVYGGVSASNSITINSTSHKTKGKIILNDLVQTKKAIIVNDQGYSSGYTTSIQSGNSATWLEILNKKGTNKGVFFGVSNDDFELWSYQGGDIKYYVDPSPTNGAVKFTMQKDGVFRVHDLAEGIVKSNKDGKLLSESENTAFNKNFGTSVKTVLEGDHSTISLNVHGVYGSIVGTTDTQILTNKTLNGSNNTITIDALNIVSGTIPVGRGGLGTTSVTGILVGNGTDTVTALKTNLSSNTLPTNKNDSKAGYSVGSRWIDISANNEYVCLDATSKHAVWANTTGSSSGSSSSVTGPNSSSDMELVRFNGSSGKIIESVGIKHYGALSNDPNSPTPHAGDKYYNTNINHEMCYDGYRSKWLSVTVLMDGSGKNGSAYSGNYYRRWNGVSLSKTLGPYVPKGTIIYIGYATVSKSNHTYEVLVGGNVVASLSSNNSASASSSTINGDFGAGIMSSRNAYGSSTSKNLQSVIYYKLRA